MPARIRISVDPERAAAAAMASAAFCSSSVASRRQAQLPDVRQAASASRALRRRLRAPELQPIRPLPSRVFIEIHRSRAKPHSTGRAPYSAHHWIATTVFVRGYS
jgi:hypothetical protein